MSSSLGASAGADAVEACRRTASAFENENRVAGILALIENVDRDGSWVKRCCFNGRDEVVNEAVRAMGAVIVQPCRAAVRRQEEREQKSVAMFVVISCAIEVPDGSSVYA